MISSASEVASASEFAARNALSMSCLLLAQVLDELDVGHIPMISVWNKVDICADPEMVQAVAEKREQTVCISAQTGQGLPQLMELVERKIQQSMVPVDVLVPYQQVPPSPGLTRAFGSSVNASLV